MRSREVSEPPPSRPAAAADAAAGNGTGEAAHGDGAPHHHPDRAIDHRAHEGGRGVRALGVLVRLGLGLAILGGSVTVAGVLVANRKQALMAPVEEVVRRVRVVEASAQEAGRVARRWEGFGTARAMSQAAVAPEVTARVVSRPGRIDPGASVEAGELLLKLDEADFLERLEAAQRAAESLAAQVEGLDVEERRLAEQVEQAEEGLRLTRWELDRLEEARAGAAAKEIEVMRLRAAVARQERERLALQQQLDSVPSRRAATLAELAARRNDAAVARRQLERTAVTAPIGGVLESINADVGEWVTAGQPVARVVDLRRIEVPLRVPASAHGAVRVRDTAQVRPTNGNGTVWEARVARVSPTVDPATRTLTVYLEVDQAEAAWAGAESPAWAGLLLPGRFVSAEIAAAAGNGQRLILAPRRAVAGDRVWVALEDDEGRARAQPRQVRVLYHVIGEFPELAEGETQWAVIGAGVEEGERVIVTNLDELVAGVRVEVVEGEE